MPNELMNKFREFTSDYVLDVWLNAEEEFERELKEIEDVLPDLESALASAETAEDREDAIIALGGAYERKRVVEGSLEFLGDMINRYD